jgi:hypothetical protein
MIRTIAQTDCLTGETTIIEVEEDEQLETE